MAKLPPLRPPRLDFARFRLSPRRRLLLIIGAIFLAAVAWRGMQYRKAERQAFHPASEVSRIEYAASRARSWRVSTIGTLRGMPFRTDQDVVCPYESQTVTYIGSKGKETVAEQLIVTRDTVYAREGNDPWTAQASPAKGVCGKGLMAGPSSLIETLQSWGASADLRPVPGSEAAQRHCQLWGFYYGGSPLPMATICLEPELQLPVELENGPLRVEYSRWNEIGGIAPPDMSESPQAPAGAPR